MIKCKNTEIQHYIYIYIIIDLFVSTLTHTRLQLNMIRYKMSPKEATQSFFNRSRHLQGKLNEINREQDTNAK